MSSEGVPFLAFPKRCNLQTIGLALSEQSRPGSLML